MTILPKKLLKIKAKALGKLIPGYFSYKEKDFIAHRLVFSLSFMCVYWNSRGLDYLSVLKKLQEPHIFVCGVHLWNFDSCYHFIQVKHTITIVYAKENKNYYFAKAIPTVILLSSNKFFATRMTIHCTYPPMLLFRDRYYLSWLTNRLLYLLAACISDNLFADLKNSYSMILLFMMDLLWPFRYFWSVSYPYRLWARSIENRIYCGTIFRTSFPVMAHLWLLLWILDPLVL